MRVAVKKRVALYLTTITSCLLVSACSWVDSTGSQGGTGAVTDVFLDDLPVGSTVLLEEMSLARITATRDTSAVVEQTFSWSEPLEQSSLASCAGVPDFNVDLAAGSLADACTDSEQCAMSFERVETEDDVAEFNLLVPQLKAPVGLRYELTVTDSDERVNTREFDFCLLAINEAPVAVNDTFVVLEGERTVFSADERNLLTNDEDDVDDSNTEFVILSEPAQIPANAAFFELGNDGSFTYESSLAGILNDQIDSFVYQLSDGVHVSTATATIRIIASNQSPELIDVIPVLTATEGVPFIENLSLYFLDPEQTQLTFSFSEESITPSEGTLALSSDGVLSGIPDEEDVGTYDLILIVDDGGATVEAPVTLMIDAAPVAVENSPPEYINGTVFNQTIELGETIRPIIPGFTDPDGDALSFAIVGNSDLPDGVEIDEDTGIVSGEPEEVTNVRNLRIEATDPFGESAISRIFYIRVR